MRKPPRNMAGVLKKPVTPRCEDCGLTKCHPYQRKDVEADGIGTSYGYGWLCGDCKFKRENPDAPAPPKMPWERRPRALQKERLFEP